MPCHQGASNASLNGPNLVGPPATTAQTAVCSNSDLACKSGVGAQQSSVPQLTQAARDAIADSAATTSRQAGVVGAAATAATAAASPQVKPITAAVAVGATVIGVAADAAEQMARPNLWSTTKNAAGIIVQTAAEGLPGGKAVAPITNELIELWKNSGSSKSIQDWINIRFGGDKP